MNRKELCSQVSKAPNFGSLQDLEADPWYIKGNTASSGHDVTCLGAVAKGGVSHLCKLISTMGSGIGTD